ncbi:hypothetical protein CIPAW_01G056500 [Carya illinoinensis]|uniref:Uncharacterized protein n=1 Tax=Carya illinoinensis TaxID=32201 RepID=A0A8T1RGV0_CARIL|nr:hypothetical protein CIPAW_01G056500 [Carya illinoinensis]KAG6729896.1 hypothetical protein I3842_01G053900 [Carya illinoinensis]
MAATLLTKRYTVVTGANKGIGFETVRKLASKGIVVVLAARDEKRGLEALQKLQHMIGLLDHVVFHQLDTFKTQFRKLDILVNNAGTTGAIIDYHALIFTETYELTEECIQTNYCGAKRMADSLIPLLQLSDSPRIVNVSSYAGKSGCTHEFLKDFKEGYLETKGWPPHMSAAYRVSKTALNAYTIVLAKRYPSFVKTDMNNNNGALSLEEGAANLVRYLALLPNGGPSGLFFIQQEVSPF